MQKVSQAEIAKVVGVSRSTVAWALNPKRRLKLKKETRERIEEVARSMDYRPHRYAQIMRRGKSGIIGILRFPGYSDFRMEIELQTLERVRGAGYQPMLARVIDPELVLGPCEELLDAQVEGVIIDGPNPRHLPEVMKRFNDAHLPVVMLSSSQTPGGVHVRSDMRQGMHEITSHLVGLGHRWLTLLLLWSDVEHIVPDMWRMLDRLHGFCDGIREAGGSLLVRDEDKPRIFRSTTVDLQPGAGEVTGEIVLFESRAVQRDMHVDGWTAARERLQRQPLPDVLVCNNDDWAVGAMRACAQAGLQVPEQIAITGHDDIGIGAYLTPPLTTARHPVEENTKTAVRLLLEMIDGKELSTRDIAIPSRLVVRESCGALLDHRSR